MNDTKSVGQDQQYKDFTDKYDAEHGEYADSAKDLPDNVRYPSGGQAPDPNPFKLGPMSAGE